MGLPLYHRVEITEASEDVIETPAEELALWQRMTIYDARALLGLYCYRAGYYPAALAQWTRIPEENRALRPLIAQLLAELDDRLALEKQVTQPLQRDQIMAPLISGNLSPADLPNPFEPVRTEEMLDGHVGSLLGATKDEDGEQEHGIAEPVSSEVVAASAQNGVNGDSHEDGLQRSALAGEQLSMIHPAPTARKHWWVRMWPGGPRVR